MNCPAIDVESEPFDCLVNRHDRAAEHGDCRRYRRIN